MRNSNKQSNRGISCGMAHLLSLLLAAAPQLAFVPSAFGQAPSSHEPSHADQMQPIAIVLAGSCATCHRHFRFLMCGRPTMALPAHGSR